MIAAEGEHKASRALRHAADVISENPAALQVTMIKDLKKDNSVYFKIFVIKIIIPFGIFKHHLLSSVVISFDRLDLQQVTSFPFTCNCTTP